MTNAYNFFPYGDSRHYWYFKYQVCKMKLKRLNTFLQFRLLFHEPHCIYMEISLSLSINFTYFVRRSSPSQRCWATSNSSENWASLTCSTNGSSTSASSSCWRRRKKRRRRAPTPPLVAGHRKTRRRKPEPIQKPPTTKSVSVLLLTTDMFFFAKGCLSVSY